MDTNDPDRHMDDRTADEQLRDRAGETLERFPAPITTPQAVRLEELRTELRAERISYGELAELADLRDYIAPGDVELQEAAGVPESEAR